MDKLEFVAEMMRFCCWLILLTDDPCVSSLQVRVAATLARWDMGYQFDDRSFQFVALRCESEEKEIRAAFFGLCGAGYLDLRPHDGFISLEHRAPNPEVWAGKLDYVERFLAALKPQASKAEEEEDEAAVPRLIGIGRRQCYNALKQGLPIKLGSRTVMPSRPLAGELTETRTEGAGSHATRAKTLSVPIPLNGDPDPAP